MALISIVPFLTSSTTPEPYVVTASSEFGSGYYGYQAFSGGVWCSKKSSHLNAWLCIDLGKSNHVPVHMFSLNHLTGTADAPCWAKEFLFQGSMDNLIWETLSEHTVDYWGLKEVKCFETNKKRIAYRYYRIFIIKPNAPNTSGNNYAYLSDIKLYFDTNLGTKISHKHASLDYILPMNTTKNIMSKRNDARVGLFGMANDIENFGDLYVVGPDGKSHLTKNGIKSEIIFDGKASSTGDYELLNSIDTFKMLMICFSCDNNTTKENTLKGTHLIPLVDIDFGETLQHLQAHCIVLVENGFINFGFKHSKLLSIGSIAKTSYNTSVQITKVIGIY